MNQRKNLIFLSFLMLTSSTVIIPVVDAKLKSQVDKADPMGLFQVLEGAKIVAFSKDFLIKGGLDEKDLKKWEDLTSVTNDLVDAALAQGAAPAQYQHYLDSIHDASVFFKDSVNALHEKYKKLGFKKIKDTVVATVGNTVFTPEAIEEMQTIVEQSDLDRKHMSEILKDILKSTVVARSWAEKYYTKSGDLKDAKDILKKYKDIIKSYKKNKLNKQSFVQFLNIQKISDSKAAQKFVDDLQGIEYIMKAKLLLEEKVERRENLGAVQEIIKKTREIYPEFLSVQEIAKLGSADKFSTIIFAQAGAYEAVLGQLNREAKALLFAAQNKQKK